MSEVKFYYGDKVPLEMHKVRIVQKLNLVPIERRLEAIAEAGNETYSNMELLRLAMPRRVFTLSQVKYAVDRIAWLYENRKLVGGLNFVEEPKVLRFFFGKLETVSDWQNQLVAKFREDFGESL